MTVSRRHCFYANKSWQCMCVCAQEGDAHHVFWIEETVGENHSVFHFSLFLSFSLSLPPWATSSGNGEGPVSSLNAANVCLRLGTRARRHTQSWHTQRSTLSLCHHSVTFPLFCLVSFPFLALPLSFPPCILRSLPASSPTLHCTQCLNIFQLCFSSQLEAF